MSKYRGPAGIHYGWCNDCGEEAPMDTECCETGEVVQYDDDTEEL